MRLTDSVEEAARVMTICNACRYCEGHCAVFQAMELRLDFNAENLDYLSNLCHNCGACYHHCQYADPHEFAVNVPQAMADLRQENYAEFAWPRAMGHAFTNNGLWVSLLLVASLTLFPIVTAFAIGDAFFAVHENSFYGVISHDAMVALFGGVSLFVLLALAISIVKFWRGMSLPSPLALQWSRVGEGIKYALSLKYLDGGNGQGCTYPDERPSMARRVYHHLTFWGFMLCFAATSTGTIYHYVFGWEAPYSYISLPKLFGTVGGIGLLIGPVGLLYLKYKAEKAVKSPHNGGMDVAFLVLLFLVSLTGLVLMVVRDTQYVGLMLTVHLGAVLALFLSMPYGKFVHGFYRLIALVAFAIERDGNRAIVGVREGRSKAA